MLSAQTSLTRKSDGRPVLAVSQLFPPSSVRIMDGEALTAAQPAKVVTISTSFMLVVVAPDAQLEPPLVVV